MLHSVLSSERVQGVSIQTFLEMEHEKFWCEICALGWTLGLCVHSLHVENMLGLSCMYFANPSVYCASVKLA